MRTGIHDHTVFLFTVIPIMGVALVIARILIFSISARTGILNLARLSTICLLGNRRSIITLMYRIGKRARDFCTTIRNRTRGFFRYRIHTLTTADKRFACYRPSCALKVVSRCSRGNFYVAIPATATTIRGDFRRNTSSRLDARRIAMPRFVRRVRSNFVVTLRATLNGVTLARTRRHDRVIIFVVMYERRVFDMYVSAIRAGKFRFSAYRTRTVALFHACAIGMRNLFLHVSTGGTYLPMTVFVLFKRFGIAVRRLILRLFTALVGTYLPMPVFILFPRFAVRMLVRGRSRFIR